MKLHPPLLAAGVLLALVSPAARADDGILNFELSQPQWAEQPPRVETAVETMPVASIVDAANQPLPIPAGAANPPMRYHSPQQLPAGVYRRGVAVALNESTSATALLPPAPPLPEAQPEAAIVVAKAPAPPVPEAETPPAPQRLALDFGLEPSAAVLIAQAKQAEPKVLADPLPGLFEGNSDSLVAWAVGSAEGTRTPNGAINPAYFGHTDPGNRVWNMGTFSYQHGAKTPAEADQKQLARLQNQGDVLRQRALKHGLNLTLEETLNGLDLANQSPLAAIGRVGYIERLAEAKANGYEGAEAIVVARTRSYINPNTGRWNAPGLGNTEPSIRRDQQRRANAVAQAIAAYETQHPTLQPQTWVLMPTPEPETLVAVDRAPAEPVDDMLRMWTSPGDPIAEAAPDPDEAYAAAPEAEAGQDSLAALWQVNLERFSQAAFPQGGGASPQIASLANVLFNRSSDPAVAVDTPEAKPAPAEPAASDAPAEIAVHSPSPVVETLAVEPLAIAPPIWAEAREGSQTMAAPVPGAVPDSTVYVPNSSPSILPEHDAAAVTPEQFPSSMDGVTATSADPEPSPETTASDPVVPTIPTNAAPQTPAAEVLTEAGVSPHPEVPLNFEQGTASDLSLEPALPSPDSAAPAATAAEMTTLPGAESEVPSPTVGQSEGGSLTE
ncbi:hypothetical protein PGN35_006275 [Nodosilinea sp. PGN35]|uniref:hypothetical protein n=1 Tax=Nodosilinea sp. PGN35 TaxID=3020489 RepID=UPI0023B23623|nr:hypothetical protein [Nodosilinea sp. TSF1-S3]MDF0367726.1 hypothetical protein [Nodosilinea sp. TSF1-S3]